MMRFCFAVLGGLIVLSSPGWAAPQAISLHARTSGDLAALCSADPGTAGADAKINYCHGFAQGAVDARIQLGGDKKPFCFPTPTPSRSSTMKEFVGWVRSMPANRDMPVLEGLFKFLGERFPCK
jgi:hypothetical protein